MDFSLFKGDCEKLLQMSNSAAVPLLDNEEEKEAPRAPPAECEHPVVIRVLAALFYGVASFLITIVNKTVLTSFKFPSFQALGLGQMLVTLVVLFVSKRFRIIDYPSFDRSVVKKIWPLPVIFVGNMIFGLGGTKELSLPMFTALRRFSILMTMIAELYVLNIRPKFAVQVSVYIMILGALIAASNDLGFNVEGYFFILMNDFFTAAYGVYMKKKLDSKELGKYGLMFYNNLFMFAPALMVCWATGDMQVAIDFSDWASFWFLISFFSSCFMGFVLSYSVLLCTFYNSALTTTIIGCLKNISVTYLGMIIGGDYVFSVLNFIGLNISVVGSLIYTYVTFRKNASVDKKSVRNRVNEV